MKPCRRYKKSVALLAASALSGREGAEVRDHVRHCPGCREYHDAMMSLCETHQRTAQSLAAVDPALEFSTARTECLRGPSAANLSMNLVGLRCRAADFLWCRRSSAARPTSGSWRFACGAIVLALLAAFWLLPMHPRVPRRSEARLDRPVQLDPGKTRVATQIAYRLALGRSSDEFERLLSDGRIPSHRVGEPTYQLLSAWSNPDL